MFRAGAAVGERADGDVEVDLVGVVAVEVEHPFERLENDRRAVIVPGRRRLVVGHLRRVGVGAVVPAVAHHVPFVAVYGAVAPADPRHRLAAVAHDMVRLALRYVRRLAARRRLVGAEADRLRVVGLAGEPVRVPDRVDDRPLLVRVEPAGDLRRVGRKIRHHHVRRARGPGRRHVGKPGDEPDPDAAVAQPVDAGDRGIGERKGYPARAQRRQHADHEVFGIERDVEPVRPAPPEPLAPTPADCDQERVRGRAGAQTRRRQERVDAVAYHQVALAVAGDADPEDGEVLGGLRESDGAVGGAGVEHVLVYGVGGAVGKRERVFAGKARGESVGTGTAEGMRVERIGAVDEQLVVVGKTVLVGVGEVRVGAVDADLVGGGDSVAVGVGVVEVGGIERVEGDGAAGLRDCGTGEQRDGWIGGTAEDRQGEEVGVGGGDAGQVVAVDERPGAGKLDLEGDGVRGGAAEERVLPGELDGVGRREVVPEAARAGGLGQEAPVGLGDDAQRRVHRQERGERLAADGAREGVDAPGGVDAERGGGVGADRERPAAGVERDPVRRGAADAPAPRLLRARRHRERAGLVRPRQRNRVSPSHVLGGYAGLDAAGPQQHDSAVLQLVRGLGGGVAGHDKHRQQRNDDVRKPVPPESPPLPPCLHGCIIPYLPPKLPRSGARGSCRLLRVELEEVSDDFGFGRVGLKTVRGKHCAVVRLVRGAQVRRHRQRVIEVGKRTVGVRGAGIENGLGGG